MVLLPSGMSPQQQGFDLGFVLAGSQLVIPKALRQIRGSIVVGMVPMPTDHTAERLLVGPVRTIWVRAPMAFLRGVGGFHRVRLYAALCRCPSQLLRDMREIGSGQVGIHGTCLKAHGCHREVLIDDAGVRMSSKHLIDCRVDRLSHMTGKALAAGATGGRKCFDPLLFQAGPQLGLSSPFLSVSLLALAQFAMKAPVLLASRGREEIGDPHINADRRG